jgi:dCMP deaminase
VSYTPPPPTPRPTFHEVFMNVAVAMSKRGTCPRLQVGAVVTVDNQIISTGYNGAPSGMAHCQHDVYTGPGARPEGTLTGSCENVVHAEVNALLRAGPAARGGTLYTTHYPCRRCWAVIANAGIRSVVYRWLYGEIQSDYEKTISVGQEVVSDTLVPGPSYWDAERGRTLRHPPTGDVKRVLAWRGGAQG